MPPTTVTFHSPLTAELGAAGAGHPARTITGLAVPFGVLSAPSHLDGIRYSFAGPPANAGDLLDVVREHDDGRVIGRLSAPMGQTDAGLEAAARIFGTTLGNDVLVEAAEGVLTGFSIAAEVSEFSTDPATGDRSVTAWSAVHLGVVRRPAFEASSGLAVAASQRNGALMPTATTTVTDPPAAPPAAQVQQLPTVAELAAQVSEALRTELEAARGGATHPLAQFATEAEYVHAVAAADPDEAARLQAAFAVPDQITTDNLALVQPGWRSNILMHLDDRRPAIGAFGRIGLPDSGMESNWPYYDGDLKTIITQQLAEKTDLAGVKISMKKGTAPIKTAGTVSDISYQLLLRSSPSYLTAYLDICRAAWSVYTEIQFETALAAGGTPTDAPPVATSQDFTSWLFGQSAAVRTATGAPANIVGVASDLFIVLGGLGGFENPKYGTQNVPGTADASTLQINVNGLSVTEFPYLADGQVIVSNSVAAKFPEQGPMVASSEDVRKLGRDVAVWGMYEDAEIYWPAGVLVGQYTATP